MKKNTKTLKRFGIATILCSISAEAAVILSTDFTGRTVSGTTASMITWVTNGVSDPGDLTVTNSTQSSGNGNLFNTGNAAGHFAVANNTGNGGVWFTDIPVTVGAADITLTTFDLGVTNFNGSGGFQTGVRDTNFTVALRDSSGTTLDTVTVTHLGNPSASFSAVAFPNAVTLVSGMDYDFRITAAKPVGGPAGNNTGIDSIAFNGTIVAVPEPSTLMLGLLGVFGLAIRRR